jgi:hypothetical protein
VIETPNTTKALLALREYTVKEVLTRPIEEFRHPSFSQTSSYLGLVCETAGSIDIYLSDRCPEETFVHEVLHKVLDYECFPNAYIDTEFAERALSPEMMRVLPNLQSSLTSTVHHPEIFARMEAEYDLDLERYYAIQVEQKMRRFERVLKIDNPALYHFFRQEDILVGLDYFLWGRHGEHLLAFFRGHFPEAFGSCLNLREKVLETGFSTPSSAFHSAGLIREHLIRYGQENSLPEKFNDMWRALEIRFRKP